MPRSWETQIDADGPANVNLVTTAETVVCTLPSVATSGPDAPVILEGAASVTLGTAATAVQLRVRRGGAVSSTLVGGASTTQGTAGQTVQASAQVDDHPGEYDGAYVLTAQQVAATGNGTAVSSNLTATVG